MKVKLSRRNILPRDMACKGRPPKSPAGLKVCHRVRSDGTGSEKTHYAEIFSTKTGKPVGYIGPGCTIVTDPKLALRGNYLNRHHADWALRDCLIGFGIGDNKKFKAALKKALKASK